MDRRPNLMPRLVVACLAFLSGVNSCAFLRAADADLPRPTLYLLRLGDGMPAPPTGSVLSRELCRQALLIAARDEMGMGTRDESLREWSTLPDGMNPWMIGNGAEGPVIRTSRGGEIWHGHAPQDSKTLDIRAELKRLETLCHEELPGVLRAQGFDATPHAPRPDAPAAKDAEARLAEMDELSQFVVIRQAHALIQTDGQSQARLGVLVRGYANLGQLCRYHWSIEHQVFVTRSLLYAQRMVAEAPASPLALQHRAYALALAGFSAAALEDIGDADALLAGHHQDEPAWVKLIEPFAHYDYRALNNLAADAHLAVAPLAAYLSAVTTEHTGCQNLSLNQERSALQLNPRCQRLLQMMCDQTGPGLLNGLAEAGPQMFSQTLGEKLEQTPDLPPKVIEQIRALRRPGGNPNGREEICQALISAGVPDEDGQELSWTYLGRMIQEITFALTERKANLICLQWGVDASDYVAQVRPLVAEHPFAPLIEMLGHWHENDGNAVHEAGKQLKLEDLSVAELRLSWPYRAVFGDGAGGDLLAKFRASLDPCSFDWEAYLSIWKGQLNDDGWREILPILETAAPDSPAALCGQIKLHFERARVDEWEKRGAAHPQVNFALAKKLEQRDDWEKAVRFYRLYLKVSPDEQGYVGLANLFKAKHDDDRWLATLKEFLDQTGAISLEHARVQQEIADYYMSQHQYAEAVPYADAAAETGSGWGLLCAARAHTGIGDFDRAEQLIIEEYKHYSSSPVDLVTWCWQTNHGDRQGALQAMADYIADKQDKLSEEDLMDLSVVEWAQGHLRPALDAINRRIGFHDGPLNRMHQVLIANELKDPDTVTQALDRMAALEADDGNDPAAVGLAKLMAARWTDGQIITPDEVEKLAQRSDRTVKLDTLILTSRYLLQHGHKNEAIDCIHRAYALGEADFCKDKIILYQMSRDLGIDPLDPAAAGKKVSR